MNVLSKYITSQNKKLVRVSQLSSDTYVMAHVFGWASVSYHIGKNIELYRTIQQSMDRCRPNSNYYYKSMFLSYASIKSTPNENCKVFGKLS